MARKPVSYLAGAALLGTAIGAVIGMMTARQSGAELRKSLKEQGERALDRVNEAGKQARESVEEAGRQLPDRLADLPRRGLESLTQFGKKHSVEEPTTQVTVEGEHAAEPPEGS